MMGRLRQMVQRRSLRSVLAEQGFIRAIEAHNALSALVGAEARASGADDVCCFDALWASSLTCSAAQGVPDREIPWDTARWACLRQIITSAPMPVIVDGDTGRDADSFARTVAALEHAGAAAVVIEDQASPKRNSLVPGGPCKIEHPAVFAERITAGCTARKSAQFLLLARIESLLVGLPVDDAICRAAWYLDAGADGIVIHSASVSPDEVLAFARRYERIRARDGRRALLGAIPTTYNRVPDAELQTAGFDVVIHANHLLRAALSAMRAAAAEILQCGRSFEASRGIATVGEVIELVNGSAARVDGACEIQASEVQP